MLKKYGLHPSMLKARAEVEDQDLAEVEEVKDMTMKDTTMNEDAMCTNNVL